MRIAATAAALAALVLGLAPAAHAADPVTYTTIGWWKFETVNSSNITPDSSSSNKGGTVGAKIVRGVVNPNDSTDHGLTFGTTNDPTVRDGQNYVPIYNSGGTLPLYNPGTKQFRITARVTMPTDMYSQGNIVQKGQAGGELWKLEETNGEVLCTAVGDSTSTPKVVARTGDVRFRDGKVHSITCERFSYKIELTVDGQLFKGYNTVGGVFTDKIVNIGGKYYCDPPTGIDCDVYPGTMYEIKFEMGSA